MGALALAVSLALAGAGALVGAALLAVSAVSVERREGASTKGARGALD